MTAPVSILGRPHATARWLGGPDDSDENNARITLGEFSLNVSLRVELPPQGTQLSDWEVGIVQMVSGPVDCNCYKRPGEHDRVFVERLVRPPGAFYADRDANLRTVWFTAPDNRPAVRDLGRLGPRQTLELRVTDFPGFKAKSFASAHTLNRSDQDVPLHRHRHTGTFYTYVAARQKATGLIVPLYIVRWWMAADYSFTWPGPGIRLTPAVGFHKFELINHHPFMNTDPVPVVSGDPIELINHRARRKDWSNRCPEFADLT